MEFNEILVKQDIQRFHMCFFFNEQTSSSQNMDQIASVNYICKTITLYIATYTKKEIVFLERSGCDKKDITNL